MLDKPFYTDEQIRISNLIRKCQLLNCQNRGEYQPVIALSSNGVSFVCIPIKYKLICSYHKSNLSIEDILDGITTQGYTTFNLIEKLFSSNNKTPPIREFSKLLWRLA